MIKQKNTGAYYTPQKLSNFIIYHLKENRFFNNLSILEPSVGDGSFIKALCHNVKDKKSLNITLLDINNEELEKAKLVAEESEIFNVVLSKNEDFLKFYEEHTLKYSLVLGNPPYIKSTLLKDSQIKRCTAIHDDAGMDSKKINNIWTSFVLGSDRFLENDGILSFVLPTDLLQVKYSEEIRKYLEENFQRIEIFTLDRFTFSDIEQHTIILFAYKMAEERGTFFYKIEDLERKKYKKISSNGLMIYETKWTHYNLASSEIKLLNKINLKLDRVNKFVDSMPGIVTGANAYFILDKNTVNKYNISKYVEPIIQKSLLVKGNFQINKNDIKKMIEDNKPMFLLNLKECTEVDANLQKYLDIGITQELKKRYKCSIRNKWYCIPNISEPTDGFIFKRYHKVPKVLKNSVKIHVTDGAYKIIMHEGYNIESFIYSFFNIVTLIFAELTGRKYGGGVMELIPSEFKNLPFYYKEVDLKSFNSFTKDFKNEEHLNTDILDFLKLTKNEIEKLHSIYKKLINERMK